MKRQPETALASRDAYQQMLNGAGFGKITSGILQAPEFNCAEAYHQQHLAKSPEVAATSVEPVSCPACQAPAVNTGDAVQASPRGCGIHLGTQMLDEGGKLFLGALSGAKSVARTGASVLTRSVSPAVVPRPEGARERFPQSHPRPVEA